jgi:tetratricopeptide (TPR) repeat protein
LTRLQQLQQFLVASPDDAFILFALAKEYEKQNEVENALSYYQTLLEKHADYVGTYYHLGKLQEQMQAFDAAVTTYTAGMQVAKKAGDHHALSELAGARLNLVDEEDE